MNYGSARDTFAEKPQAFVKEFASQTKYLVLDGTGPRVTMLLPFLQASGRDTLSAFERVYAFSGGVYAYFNYLAYNAGAYKHPVNCYYNELDKTLRSAHRQKKPQLLHLVKNYINKRPLYPYEPFRDVVDFSFDRDFLNSKLIDVAPNFYPYIGIYGQSEPVPLDEANGFDRQNITVRDALAMAVKVPFLYGGGTKEDIYYDANYAPGFLMARHKLLSNGNKTLCMTMWEYGIKNDAHFVNISRGREAKKILRRDVVSILFNIPNRYYEEDLRLTYDN